MTGPNDLDDECRQGAIESLEQEDWYAAYTWAKSWINRGGGGLLDPWLVYVASALMHGQPRTAVHSVDLALRGWFTDPADRSVLHFVRSRVVWHRLRDPKTAEADLATACRDAPAWLEAAAKADDERRATDAATSRKRKASVEPAPSYEGVSDNLSRLGDRRLEPGSQPALWPLVSTMLDSV